MNRSHTPRRLAAPAVLLAAAIMLPASNAAVTEGRTSDGRRFVAGGIGTEEVDRMRGEAPAYSLQLVTAAPGGAYLAGTHVRIVGPGNQVVLDTTIDAPWLLVDLPGGRYTVHATYGGKTVERRITIADGKPQRVVVHFDAPVDQAPGAAPPAMPR